MPGSGLGLSIVRQVVARHAGTVAVHNREGGGTRFTVVLRAPPPARRELQAPRYERQLTGGPRAPAGPLRALEWIDAFRRHRRRLRPVHGEILRAVGRSARGDGRPAGHRPSARRGLRTGGADRAAGRR
ncbi:MAG TPA: ATP-binding protein, partial [Propionibacteriaceae bacterium]|nr:ATP-binding protein [Propionibacteriaceae bacterium]